jgi:CRP/FNR family cyclic AMP-dependent transcriptional regulator
VSTLSAAPRAFHAVRHGRDVKSVAFARGGQAHGAHPRAVRLAGRVENPPQFLSLLAPEDRRAVEQNAIRRRYARGSVILHSGDDAAGVLILIDGRVKIVAPDAEGHDAVLGFRGPGDLVGELSALDGHSRSSSVAALEPVETLALAGRDFRRLLDEHPGIGSALLQVLAARLRAADSERADFGSHDVLGRVARRLVDLSERYGVDAEEGVAITLPITQEELAGWTGASREAVSKSLAALRELGWVQTHRRELVVTDIESLRTYTG